MTFSAVILAGGRSRRMGCDKAWLNYKRQPLIARQLATVRRLGPSEIFISAFSPEQFPGLDWPVLIDNFPGQGPLAGLERALEAMRSPLLLVLAVDMPQMTATLLRRLLRHCRERTGVVPRMENRIEPLAAFYPKTTHPLLRHALDAGSNAAIGFAQLCVASGLVECYDVPASQAHRFANWNAPGDLDFTIPSLKTI